MVKSNDRICLSKRLVLLFILFSLLILVFFFYTALSIKSKKNIISSNASSYGITPTPTVIYPTIILITPSPIISPILSKRIPKAYPDVSISPQDLKQGLEDIEYDESTDSYVALSGTLWNNVLDENYAVFLITTEGEVVSKFGKLRNDYVDITYPTDLDVDSSGNVYVLDRYKANPEQLEEPRITKYDKNGSMSAVLTDYASNPFWGVNSITVDQYDNLLVLDRKYRSLFKFDSHGNELAHYFFSSFSQIESCVYEIEVNDQDQLFMACREKVIVFDMSLNRIYHFAILKGDSVRSFAMDNKNKVVAVEYSYLNDLRIFLFSFDRSYLTSVGQPLITQNGRNYLSGPAFNGTGDLILPNHFFDSNNILHNILHQIHFDNYSIFLPRIQR